MACGISLFFTSLILRITLSHKKHIVSLSFSHSLGLSQKKKKKLELIVFF
jgi:hypothetical protein